MKKISSDQKFWLYCAWLFMDDDDALDLYVFFLRMAGISRENLKGNLGSEGYFTTETAKAARKIQLEAFKSRRK